MRRYRLLAVVAVLAIVGLVAAPLAAHTPGNIRSGNTAGVSKDEVVEASVYLAGTTVTVAGTVKGDLYCAGQNIDITGSVEGDVLCAGQTVSVSGNVLGDVRVAGQTVTLAGPIARSLTAFGQTVTQTGSTVVGMDATVFGSSLQLGGKVNRDMTVGGQTITLAGQVGRNVTAMVDQLSLASSARVGGDMEYTSRNQIDKAAGAAVSGNTARHDPPAESSKTRNEWADRFWGVAFWFGSWVVLGLLLLGLMPRSYRVASDAMIRQGGWALLAGVAALIMTPIVAVLLMVTVLGIPAGAALLLLWIVAMMAACAYSGYALGQWLINQTGWKVRWPQVSALVLGLFTLALLMLVPVVGGLFSFLALVWGLGGIVLAAGKYYQTRGTQATAPKKAKTS